MTDPTPADGRRAASSQDPITPPQDPIAPPQDEVDRILDAWAAERPDLNTTPLAVLSRVTRIAAHLAAVRRSAFAASSLEPWEFDVLSALRRAGQPYELSPGELLRETLVTSGTMTTRIDKLTARHLVARRADPRDGRSRRVRLTARGRGTVDAALERLVAVEQELLAPLGAADRERTADLLRTLALRIEGTPGP